MRFMDNALARMRTSRRSLSPRLAQAASYVAEHPFDAATLPMRALAARAGQTPATLTRLAQALGLDGWDELRAGLIEEARPAAPYSDRPVAGIDLPEQVASADRAILATLPGAAELEQVAQVLERAERVLVAGFRSSAAPAALFHYQYRLFRDDVSFLGGAGALDLELGALGPRTTLVLFGFAPYSRDSLLAARDAAASRSELVAIVDRADAPIAAGAAAVLTFATATPAFFPSLTGAVAIAQALAAVLFERSGDAGRSRLRRTEARIAAHSVYLRQEDAP